MAELIKNQQILNKHLDELIIIEPRLKQIREKSAPIPLRLREGGFAGMSAIISAQMLSAASANAIYERLGNLLEGEINARSFLKYKENDYRKIGFSKSKFLYLQNLALKELNGELDFTKFEHMPAEQALEKLISLKGIGVWSAQIYLLFCIGHADIFPAGDLVLQKMLGLIFELKKKPSENEAKKLTQNWSPYRGAGARLLWRYFAILKNKEGIKIE